MAQDTQRAAQQAYWRKSMNSAVNGAKAGAIAGGGLSAFFNAKDVIDGQKEWDDALFDTGKDTLVAAGKGCVANVGSVAVKEGLKRAGAQSIARSSAPVAIAMGGVEIGINTVRIDIRRYGWRRVYGREYQNSSDDGNRMGWCRSWCCHRNSPLSRCRNGGWRDHWRCRGRYLWWKLVLNGLRNEERRHVNLTSFGDVALGTLEKSSIGNAFDDLFFAKMGPLWR